MTGRLAKYTMIVRHKQNPREWHGLEVVVYAASKQEASEKAISIGWSGDPDDVAVDFTKVVEVRK